MRALVCFIRGCAVRSLFLTVMLDLKIISSRKYEEMKNGKELIIHFGFHDSPFGKCLVGLLGERICHVSFVYSQGSVNLKVLKTQWPGTAIVEDQKLTEEIAVKIFKSETELFKILLKGSPFEALVWRTLVNIPKGKTVSYENVAETIGNVKAVRAVGNAVAKNSVAYLVPCHRVIKKNGSLHKYRWGSHVKQVILKFEKYHC